jgi:23S rRNA pseudouridine1911/1915/1917 synthase
MSFEPNTNTYSVVYDVSESHHGTRLDSFLKEKYRKRSREKLKDAIESGSIQVIRNQGNHVSLGKLKASSTLILGDQVKVISRRTPEPEVNMEYSIIHEDEHLIIIDKPANLPVHPAGKYFYNSLLTDLRMKNMNYYLVHRIDKETSGILVMSKTEIACAPLVEQFSSRKVKKTYLAIVKGKISERLVIDTPMGRDLNSYLGLKMTTYERGQGQEAITEVEPLSHHRNKNGDFTLVKCFPKTGRQHQIRVHLASVDHPIVGDKLYGLPESEALKYYERQFVSAEAQARLLLPRHALHAHQIKFEHPITGKPLSFESKLPKQLSEFLGM